MMVALPRIRLGMVGGGEDAFIGAVHRMAARLDDHFDFVAGALSSSVQVSSSPLAAGAAALGAGSGCAGWLAATGAGSSLGLA